MVLESTGAEEEEHALRKLDEINCDGFLLYVRHLSAEKITSYTRTKPVVLLDASHAGEIATVTFGHYQAAFEATQKLIQAGHRNIAVVGGPDSRHSAIARVNGCVDAIRNAGLPWDAGYALSGSYDQEFGEAATLELLGKKPDITAIVYCGERACSGGLRGLRTLGKNVPEDIAIISFDSFGLTQYLAPHIDSVIYPVKEMAEYGVSEVLNKLFNKEYQIGPKEFTHHFIGGDSIRRLTA